MTVTKRQTKKHIYDWADLEAAVTERRRLSKTTPVSEYALARAISCWGAEAHIAQLSERVIAKAHPCHIQMHYLFTPKEKALDHSKLQSSVNVFPAAGGRTTYCVDNSVNGWFANANLPLNASDRSTKSRYKSSQWFYGQAGVYQRGTGPYYPDVGPSCANSTIEDVLGKLEETSGITSEAWREAAATMMRKIADVVEPFRDTILRFEPGIYEPDRHALFNLGGYHYQKGFGYRNSELGCNYGINIRLKSPHVSGEDGWEMVPDFIVQVAGPPFGIQDPPKVIYGAILAHPQGRGQVTEYRQAYSDDPTYQTGLGFAISKSPSAIIEAARQWAANRIYIPCA